MHLRRGIAAVGVALAMLVTAAPAGADITADEAAEICRHLDEAGELDLAGGTRGECINSLHFLPSETFRNTVAGACGFDAVQQRTGTTSKGQCIQFFTR